MIEKFKAHEWKQINFYTINEEALKAKIAPSEEEEEEELSPIESVKSAIALLEKHYIAVSNLLKYVELFWCDSFPVKSLEFLQTLRYKQEHG
jgi:DNA topoisomerase IA